MIVTTGTQNVRWFLRDTRQPARGPLVLLHGFTGCSGFWEDIVARLQSDFRCLAPDLPGHGRTEMPEGIEHYRLRCVADTLALVLQRVDVSETAVWGYSMGGRLALQFAVAYPDRVTRLVLESASPGIADSGDRLERRQSDERLADEIEEIGVEAFVSDWENRALFSTQRQLSPARQRHARGLRLGNRADGLAMSLRGMGVGAQDPLHRELSRLAIPTLILAGEEDEKFRSVGHHMASEMPNAIYRVMPGAGHMTFWEKPETSLEIVRPFLLGREPPDPFARENQEKQEVSDA